MEIFESTSTYPASLFHWRKPRFGADEFKRPAPGTVKSSVTVKFTERARASHNDRIMIAVNALLGRSRNCSRFDLPKIDRRVKTKSSRSL